MPETMKDRSYEEIAARRRFQKTDPNPIERHRQEGREAVEVAHARELGEITRCLSSGQSVLVECDKALAGYILDCITDEQKLPAMRWNKVAYNDAAPNPPDSVVGQLIRILADKLQGAFNTSQGNAIVIRHLDLMMWTAENRPRPELNDVIFWLAEFPSVVKLLFWDPVFPVPKLVGSLFPNRLSLQAFDRSVLWQLVTPSEAKKLSSDHAYFTVSAQSTLYQYVSGTNVVELRRILRGLNATSERIFMEHPSNLGHVYEYIRSQTGMAPIVRGGEVAGYEQLREQLEREVKFPIALRRQAKDEVELRQADALVPRGVILFGPPGTGKTEWAKWLAAQLDTPLFTIHGPELKNKYVGETEAAIRQMFSQARRAAPAMILIDEIDAMTPARAGSESNFEAGMVAQFLSEMDGLRREESVIVVGTTNRLEAVDEAFLRPGRFSIQIEVGYPEAEDRRHIIEYYKQQYLPELKPESIEMLVKATGESLDPNREKELRQYFDAYVNNQIQPDTRQAAGPELKRQLERQFGLDQAAAKFSGDHLRAICLYLLRESLYRDPRPDVNDRGLLQQAVEAVRRRRNPPGEPSAPVPLDWTNKRFR